ncbi:serine/threonine-protein phosphatase 5-like isoform X1 [Bidens hawaiensis]|uniref:serine/threonine-protein phosphatase 5-like isoform X1 n=1 Tax=Bidens hawaiensis TaxID=980011 RepID=UPI004049696B
MPTMSAATQNSNLSLAEQIKQQANEAFKGNKFSQAIDLYTKAIELNGGCAVYLANRAFAHAKLEEYGSVIQDASKAIEIDPKYSKGYYRRGAAYLSMGKFKEALKDFQQVKRISPNDPDASKKLKECEKAVMKLKFEEAISVPTSEQRSVAESIDFRTIGAGTGSSYHSYQVTAAVAVALMAILLLVVRPIVATVVASAAVLIFLVVNKTGWWAGYSDGFLTKSQVLNIDVEPRYAGARIEGDVVTLDFVKKMMDDFKNQKLLHKRYAFQIVLQTREILMALPSLVDINVPDGKHFTVCGDVHGQFFDLLNIFELNGLPSEENPYLFNGDFVDRGSFSVEVILTLFAFKCMSPSAIHLSRGNHESKSMNKIYGFEGEVRSKLSDKFVELFSEVFCYLPLAHVINEKIFVVHGGLFSTDDVKLSDIRAIDRFCEPPEEGLMCEILWSDPQPNPGRGPSKRGVGLSFGGDVTKRFLKDNNLDLVLRSHEVKDEGYEIDHDGKLITVFSAPNYCDQMGNKGAFIRFEAPTIEPKIVTFSAVPHPDVKPMAYASNFLRMFN